MKLTDIGEFGFIDRISQGCLIRPERVVKAIGDDCAGMIPKSGQVALMTTDLLVERVHFLREATTGFNLGHKALAVNLSDIAAMGGTPTEAFVSIAIPEDCPVDFLDDLYGGMKSLAKQFGVNILGGDTTHSKQDLIINIGVLGSVKKEEMLCRDNARVGDVICTTGYLGDSRAGLHLVLNEIAPDSDDLKALFDTHILPEPHVREGRFLAQSGAATAAIDVSDGLSSDLNHIVRQSNVGARIYDPQLPISDALSAFCRRFGFDPVEYALAGGEDYTLLVTISADRAEAIRQSYREKFGHPLHAVGKITDSGMTERVGPDGRVTKISPSGWDHFRGVNNK
jgi:thiamine-monophosphate kinase